MRGGIGRVALVGMLALSAGCNAPARPREGTQVLRIYLARHGETDWNAQRRLQGKSDIPLNDHGRAQAEALAVRLEGLPLDAIYSSPLARSKATAEELEGRAPIQVLDGLAEQGLGKFEGAWFDGRDPAIEADFRTRAADPDDTLDGGESTHQHLERVRAAVEEIRKRHPSGAVLIVGHGGTNRMILAVLLDLDLQDVERIRQANDEVYAIDLVKGRPPGLWKLIPLDKLEEL